jgi:hypothetical protein
VCACYADYTTCHCSTRAMRQSSFLSVRRSRPARHRSPRRTAPQTHVQGSLLANPQLTAVVAAVPIRRASSGFTLGCTQAARAPSRLHPLGTCTAHNAQATSSAFYSPQWWQPSLLKMRASSRLTLGCAYASLLSARAGMDSKARAPGLVRSLGITLLKRPPRACRAHGAQQQQQCVE